MKRILSRALWATACICALNACGEPPADAPPDDVLAPRSSLGDEPLSGAEAVDDSALKARVAAALKTEGGVDPAAITITVARGEVKLNGVVPAEQIVRADALVRKVDGVKVVINALRPATPSS